MAFRGGVKWWLQQQGCFVGLAKPCVCNVFCHIPVQEDYKAQMHTLLFIEEYQRRHDIKRSVPYKRDKFSVLLNTKLLLLALWVSWSCLCHSVLDCEIFAESEFINISSPHCKQKFSSMQWMGEPHLKNSDLLPFHCMICPCYGLVPHGHLHCFECPYYSDSLSECCERLWVCLSLYGSKHSWKTGVYLWNTVQTMCEQRGVLCESHIFTCNCRFPFVPQVAWRQTHLQTFSMQTFSIPYKWFLGHWGQQDHDACTSEVALLCCLCMELNFLLKARTISMVVNSALISKSRVTCTVQEGHITLQVDFPQDSAWILDAYRCVLLGSLILFCQYCTSDKDCCTPQLHPPSWMCLEMNHVSKPVWMQSWQGHWERLSFLCLCFLHRYDIYGIILDMLDHVQLESGAMLFPYQGHKLCRIVLNEPLDDRDHSLKSVENSLWLFLPFFWL